jgi:hypothetical protein
MRLLRFRLRTLMLVVAAVAGAMGIGKWLSSPDHFEVMWVVVLLMPTIAVLAATLFDLGDEVWRDIQEWRSRSTRPR